MLFSSPNGEAIITGICEQSYTQYHQQTCRKPGHNGESAEKPPAVAGIVPTAADGLLICLEKERSSLENPRCISGCVIFCECFQIFGIKTICS